MRQECSWTALSAAELKMKFCSDLAKAVKLQVQICGEGFLELHWGFLTISLLYEKCSIMGPKTLF